MTNGNYILSTYENYIATAAEMARWADLLRTPKSMRQHGVVSCGRLIRQRQNAAVRWVAAADELRREQEVAA